MPLLVLAAVALTVSAATLTAVHLLHRRSFARRVDVPDTVPLEWTRAWERARRVA